MIPAAPGACRGRQRRALVALRAVHAAPATERHIRSVLDGRSSLPAAPSAPSAGALTAIRECFAALYPTAEKARLVLADADIRADHMNLTGSPQDIWFAALTEATHHDALQSLLAVARRNYPSNPTLAALALPPPGR